MSIMMYMLRQLKESPFSPRQLTLNDLMIMRLASSEEKKVSPRMQEFKQKLRQTTPIKGLKEITGKHPNEEMEPLKPWPHNTNPHTGEIGGPKGPEPTRYGDWERKGRVSDF